MKAVLHYLDGSRRGVEEGVFGDTYIISEMEPGGVRLWEHPVMRERIFKRFGGVFRDGETVMLFKEIPGGRRWRAYRDADGNLRSEELPPEEAP